MTNQLDLYNKYFVQNDSERLDLFIKLKEIYRIKKALYLGSFVHVTPSFVYPETVFVDSDRRVEKFFTDDKVLEFVKSRKQYDEEPNITAYQQSYEDELPLKEGYFDLLISQYAGFVSKTGKKFLKKGGILIANNSHADAGLASLDDDYEFIGVANHVKDIWKINQNTEGYFEPKKGPHPTKEELLSTMKGIGYTKVASNYIFRKIL